MTDLVDFPLRNTSGDVLFVGRVSRHTGSAARAALAEAVRAGAKLVGVDLAYADLAGVDLADVNLGEANLSYANLTMANLTLADLTGACMSDAALRGARMFRANLTSANLYRANLYRANLTRANLTRANLTRANVEATIFGEANLAQANLRSIRADVEEILDLSPAEVPDLLRAIEEGRIDGSMYVGDCACLVGTLAKIRGCDYERIPELRPDSTRPAERWFLNLRPGDTPRSSQVADVTAGWVRDWIVDQRWRAASAEES